MSIYIMYVTTHTVIVTKTSRICKATAFDEQFSSTQLCTSKLICVIYIVSIKHYQDLNLITNEINVRVQVVANGDLIRKIPQKLTITAFFIQEEFPLDATGCSGTFLRYFGNIRSALSMCHRRLWCRFMILESARTQAMQC